MFQGVERLCQHIFCILVIEKSDLEEFPQVLFEVGEKF
jgi:hypothetical protein